MKRTPKFFVIDEDAFFERFQPIQNHIDDGHGFDGHMFETYGAELAFVRQMLANEPERVWTVVECDGVMSIESGYHYVNRFGYLITRHACEKNCCYSVTLEDLTDSDDEEVPS
jgi:hypothetical protein